MSPKNNFLSSIERLKKFLVFKIEDSMIGTCERCNQTKNGKQYHFYYAKYLSTKKHSYGIGLITEVTTTHYNICGIVHVFICHTCLIKKVLLDLMYLLLCILPFPIMRALGWDDSLEGFPPNSPLSSYNKVIYAAGGLLGVICFLKFLSLILTIEHIGENIAIKMKRRQYKAQGFSNFFREDQYKKLEKH